MSLQKMLSSHGCRDESACACLQRVLSPGSSPGMPRFRDEWIEYKYYYNPNPAKEFPLRNKQVIAKEI